MADLRTPAEIAYDAERSGAAYIKPAANQDDMLTGILTDLYGSDESEYAPVPPVPSGYPTDKAFLHKWYGETFVTIDRRDGEMVICHRDEMGGTILSPDFAFALFKFFDQKPIKELMYYHLRRAGATPETVRLVEMVEAHQDDSPFDQGFAAGRRAAIKEIIAMCDAEDDKEDEADDAEDAA